MGDGMAYTWDELHEYYASTRRYSEAGIKAYGNNECQPVASGETDEKAAGDTAHQTAELGKKSQFVAARLEAEREKAEEVRKAAEDKAGEAKKAAEDAARQKAKAGSQKKIDPEDGKAYTWDQLHEYYASEWK